MKINAIGVTTFTGKEQVVKKTASLATVGAVFTGALLGLSKPNKEIEADAFVKAHDDDGDNPFDPLMDSCSD